MPNLNRHLTTKARQKFGGISLLESLLVLALIAFIAFWAVPSFQRFNAKPEIKTSLQSLLNDIRLLRSEARRRYTTAYLCYSPDQIRCADINSGLSDVPWEDGWLAFIDADANGQQSSNEPAVITGRAKGATQIRFNRKRIVINHLGVITVSGRISFSHPDSDHTEQIVITNQGHIRL